MKREILMWHELSIVSRMCYNNKKSFSNDIYKYRKQTTSVLSSEVALLSGSWPMDYLEMKDRLMQRGGLWILNELSRCVIIQKTKKSYTRVIIGMEARVIIDMEIPTLD